jgi:hypothetical protein
MTSIPSRANSSLGAGRYEIRVGGRLDARWAASFAGLRLGHASDGTTVIDGRIADQAALYGLLQRLRDLGLPLVSVTRIEPAEPGAPAHCPRTPIHDEGDHHD